MENENLKNIGIGTKEAEKLEAKRITVVGTRVEMINIKGTEKNKIVLICKHPDREEPIEISSVKTEREGKLKISGLWLSLDEDGLVMKQSSLAVLLRHVKANTINEMETKEIDTVMDDRGYLCVKAY